MTARDPDLVPERILFKSLTLAFGLLAAATGVIGILTARFGIILVGSANNRMIALSAAMIWIFLGLVFAYHTARPLKRIAGIIVQAVLVLIAVTGIIEFVFSIQGSHFIVENFFVSVGTMVFGGLSSPISPAALGLAVPAAVMLILLIRSNGSPAKPRWIPEATGVTGLAIVLVSFTFVLSYAFRDPLLYGTKILPIAFISALAALFTGVALIAAAGPGAVPARYMIGNSTSARLLRTFVPLVIGLILVENFVISDLSSWLTIHDSVLFSSTIVIFAFITAFVVARVSGGLGEALDRAERELVRKNEDLGTMNEELTAIEEELRQTNDDLLLHERQLVEKNDDLNVLNEELTATQEELHQNFDELTKTERTLRESEDRFRTIAETLPVLISLSSAEDSTILFTNTAYNEAFGFRSEEIIGRKGPDVYYDPAEREKMIAAIRDQGFVSNYPLKAKKADGTLLWLLSSVRPITYGGKPAIIGASVDITERRKAEEALVESQKENTFLADLLNRSEQPFGVGYPDGRLGIVNGAFERLTGYTADDLRTTDWATTLTPPEWREPEQKSLEELHRTGLPVRYEKEYLRKDGTRVSIELLVQLVKDSNGNPLHYFSFITDITERKRAKEELERKNDNLNALNEELTATEEELHQNLEELTLREEDLSKALAEKEVLLSEIHHRVKNNLTAFISLLSLDGSTEDTPAGKLLKQDLQNRARSMALIHETLYRTHMYDEVDMGMYLTTLLDQIGNSFRTTRSVKTVVDASGVMLDIPRATPAGLIVNELVTNSFKYAFPESFDVQVVREAPPTVTIALTKTDGEYVLTVKDNGVGLQKGFDITKTQTLGLKLVNFLAKHQLRARVEVNAENGTEFTIRFKESSK
jgi:PAS domain S-box-containing protein